MASVVGKGVTSLEKWHVQTLLILNECQAELQVKYPPEVASSSKSVNSKTYSSHNNYDENSCLEGDHVQKFCRPKVPVNIMYSQSFSIQIFCKISFRSFTQLQNILITKIS